MHVSSEFSKCHEWLNGDNHYLILLYLTWFIYYIAYCDVRGWYLDISPCNITLLFLASLRMLACTIFNYMKPIILVLENKARIKRALTKIISKRQRDQNVIFKTNIGRFRSFKWTTYVMEKLFSSCFVVRYNKIINTWLSV